MSCCLCWSAEQLCNNIPQRWKLPSSHTTACWFTKGKSDWIKLWKTHAFRNSNPHLVRFSFRYSSFLLQVWFHMFNTDCKDHWQRLSKKCPVGLLLKVLNEELMLVAYLSSRSCWRSNVHTDNVFVPEDFYTKRIYEIDSCSRKLNLCFPALLLTQDNKCWQVSQMF